MILDRELQRKLLTNLSEVYPFRYDFSKDFQYGSVDYEKAVAKEKEIVFEKADQDYKRLYLLGMLNNELSSKTF